MQAMRNDRDAVPAAVVAGGGLGDALAHASRAMKDDREVVLAAESAETETTPKMWSWPL